MISDSVISFRETTLLLRLVADHEEWLAIGKTFGEPDRLEVDAGPCLDFAATTLLAPRNVGLHL